MQHFATYRDLVAEFQPILERSNEAYVKELSALGPELTLEEVSGQLAEAEKTLETITSRIPATVRLRLAPMATGKIVCLCS